MAIVTAPPPRRPWHRRKRTWAAVALWLVALPLLYALSMGPAIYAVERGWLSADAYDSYGRFTFPAARNAPDAIYASYRAYIGWWDRIGRSHAASN